MSSNDIDVKTAIKELDRVLAKQGEQYTLYTCGGAALIFLGYEGRGTGDVDVILEQFDKPLESAVAEVAKQLKISKTWLNNQVTPLGARLGKGWKNKCQTLFQGSAVTLMTISRQDLISSKLHAAVDRQAVDYTDIIWLKPTKQELDIAKAYTLKQGTIETYEVWVNHYVQELMNELGIK